MKDKIPILFAYSSRTNGDLPDRNMWKKSGTTQSPSKIIESNRIDKNENKIDHNDKTLIAENEILENNFENVNKSNILDNVSGLNISDFVVFLIKFFF